MAKITIAELDIDVQAMLASTSQVKKSIDELKNKQSELVKSGDTNSKAFVENAGNLRVLNAEYTAGVKALADNTKATADQANKAAMLDLALKGEVSTIAEARAQNALLNKLRNETNVTTEAGKKQLIDLNDKLDKNNAFIKSNADAYLQQKINIGNYSGSMKEALQSLNPLNGGMAGLASRAAEAGGAGNLLKQSLSGVITGMLGMIKASLAFIATPVGAIVAFIAGSFMILYSIFKNFKPLLNPIIDAFSALSAVFETLKSGIFQLVTGGKSLSQVFGSLGGECGKAATEAYKLAAANRDIIASQRTLDLSTAKTRAEITKLMAQSKNVALTEDERMAKLQQSIKLEEELTNKQLTQNNKKIASARLTIAEGKMVSEEDMKQMAIGNSTYAQSIKKKYNLDQGALDKLREMEIEKQSILEASSRVVEKANNFTEKLADRKEKREQAEADRSEAANEKATARAEKAIEAGIAKSKSELDFFIASQGIKAKSLEEELKLAEQVRDKKLAILRTELEKGKITQAEYNLQALTEKQTFLKTQADITVANADQELKNFVDANKSKLEANKFFTDESVNQELSRLASIEAAQIEAERVRFENGLINKQAYEDAVKAIDEKTKADQQVVIDAKIAADLEKNAIDQENRIAANENEFTQKQLDLDRAYQQELDAAEKTGADVKLINEKYASFQKQLNRDVQTAQLKGVSDTLAVAASLFKEHTLAYKALSIAQITIDTILSAQAAYKSTVGIPVIGPTLAPIAAGVAYASGAMNIAKVAGVKFEQGGIQEVGGKRHAQGGTKFWGEDGTMFEAEQGEGIGVLNRGAFASFMDFNNSHGGGKSTPTFMAGGGIITQGVQSQSNGMNADDILNIIKSMPAPVVAVTDIHSASDNYARVVNGADF